MKIGEVAKASGCHLETIRYYERIGLLPPPQRTASGYRDYSLSDVQRACFITRGRDLGFSLDEIRSLMRLTEDPDLSCERADHLAQHHLAEIRERIAQLQGMARELELTIKECAGGRRAACAILGTLNAPTSPRPKGRPRAKVHGSH
jgi:MerR family mercuric resistance operon transcriptional regulator